MRLRTPLPAFLVLAIMSWALPAGAEDARLVILHTTDLHGSLTAFDYAANHPAARGLVKIASLVDSVRTTGMPVLLLDDGDAIEGGPLEAIYQRGDRTAPDPMMAAMSRMGYDAMAVGNHEFTYGPTAREGARTAASFPWLAANVVREPDGSPAFAASVVKTAGALRVGIVGVCTPAVPFLEDSASWSGLRFLPPVDAARREVERLRASERCDVIVLLAHTGLESDTSAVGMGGSAPADAGPDENWGYRLMTGVPGVDVLILGHTHVVLNSLERGGVIASQAGKWGEQLGRLDLTMTRDASGDPWRVKERRARVIPVTDRLPVSTALAALAEPYHQATQAALDRVIAHATAAIGAPHGRYEDNAAWELVQRAQLEASGADVSIAALFDPAARFGPGAVTVRDAFRLYPYENSLGVVKLSGRQLRDVLEHAARYLATYSFEAGRDLAEPGRPGYQFDMARGVTYEIDLTQPAGRRVVNLRRHGEPLADDDTLRVVANGYRLSGGGGYPWLRGAPRAGAGERSVRDLLIGTIERAGTLDASYSPGWRLLPDYAAAPERPLIDRLVREGLLPRAEVLRLGPEERARRGDLAYWLARAFGWRETKRSNAFADVPDSLAPWLDGLLKRKVLGEAGTRDLIRPFVPAIVSEAQEWCERAARQAGLAVAPTLDPSFRRGLLAGIGDAPHGEFRSSHGDTLTRAQVLAMVSNARFPQIRILETTDFHGAILGGGKDRRSGRAYGGSAVLAAWIEKLRDENPAGTVLIDGGDCCLGTMISNLQFGRPMFEQMNALGYTAMAVGNHDFDWSADTLARHLQGMKFAALGANMVERKSGRMPRWARADTIVSRRGVRLAILGMCYNRTPSVTLAKYVKFLRFDDDSATAARLVPGLRKVSDIVIEVGHTPAETDSSRAAVSGDLPRLAHVPGVAAWFGGHSHNQVLDRVDGAPVTIAGSHGEYVGVCDLVVDPIKNRVIESSTRLVRTYADEVTPDSAMLARVDRWNAAIAPIAAQHVGRALHAVRRNRGENLVGNLVSDAMRAAAGADVALQNSGGLRADLQEGEITRGAVYEVMPFDNVVFVIDLTGAEVRLALEQGLKRGRVTQVSGLRYSYDPDRPPLDRVLKITDPAGAPLDSTKVYRVATNDFMATGGDDYEILAGGRHREYTGISVRDALEKYIAGKCADGGSIDVQADGRISRSGRPGGGGD
jgi:2',3'-cyclic-nucleotide 2'-phosphodiesterase/3'-nucleotidase